jgi:hypothetical protein
MTYTWNVGGTSSTTTGNSKTSQALTAATTYTVQLTNSNGCVGNVSSPATITVNALPAITLLSGGTNQSVNSGTAITQIKYTTANASSATVSNLPAGITGVWSSNTFTISGSSTVTGAKVYTVTTINSNNCTNATASGTITVNVATPSGAASTQTWIFGSQTWSDRVVVAPSGCASVTTLSETSYPPAQYKISSNRYYYNWTCVNTASTQLCPSPWRVPTRDDFNTLGNNATGSTLGSAWGYGGYAAGNNIYATDSYGYYWSSTELGGGNAYYFCHLTSSTLTTTAPANQVFGYQVRCVKD